MKYSPENFYRSIELSSWRAKHAGSDFLGLFIFKILPSGDQHCVLLSLHLVKERKRSASAIVLLINGGLPDHMTGSWSQSPVMSQAKDRPAVSTLIYRLHMHSTCTAYNRTKRLLNQI